MVSEKRKREYIKTGIPGFDKLFKHGIPKGVPVVLAGGTGSGKTIGAHGRFWLGP